MKRHNLLETPGAPPTPCLGIAPGLGPDPALALTLHQFAESLGNAVDAKDHCTSAHSAEVAAVSQELARRMGFSVEQAELIHLAGHLHDIGKIGVPDRVLSKPGPLTPEEWELVRRHPVIGAEIVRPVKALAGPGGLVEMILHHHERFDGAGYPAGLAGADIPLGARVIAVADSLSAMMQVRPYKGPRTFAEAAQEIARLAGVNYDPVVVEAFLDNQGAVAAQLAASRPQYPPAPGRAPDCPGRCPNCRL